MIESIAAAVGVFVTVGGIFLSSYKKDILSEVDRKLLPIQGEISQQKQESIAFQVLSQERDKNMFESLGELKQLIKDREKKFEDSVKRFHERVDDLEDSFARKNKHEG
jgi:predicted  nucleic acid-binding Zn-ribbon protein